MLVFSFQLLISQIENRPVIFCCILLLVTITSLFANAATFLHLCGHSIYHTTISSLTNQLRQYSFLILWLLVLPFVAMAEGGPTDWRLMAVGATPLLPKLLVVASLKFIKGLEIQRKLNLAAYSRISTGKLVGSTH